MGVNFRNDESLVQTMPFNSKDITAGTETELACAVIGAKDDVDLSTYIQESNYVKNLQRQIQRGDSCSNTLKQLLLFINENKDNIWPNSFVQIPIKNLNPYALSTVKQDLKKTKQDINSPLREDYHKFFVIKKDQACIRVPISYLLKLALADVIGQIETHKTIHYFLHKTMDCFLNDNTSAEITSFYVSDSYWGKNIGDEVAFEKAMKFLMSNLLLNYANKKFDLQGQKPLIYFCPHTPLKQKHLCNIVTDSFYRELFMNPCLSGWDNGFDKHLYMHLCHEVLTRSYLNGILKLKRSGIINRNYLIIQNFSNSSLANNGTHVSIASKKLTNYLRSFSYSSLNMAYEKYFSDLVVKIVEHFLGLFVGSYSSACAKIDFQDFLPEKLLGFLAHELDYTDLMIFWKNWNKKSMPKFLGKRLAPSGIGFLDSILQKLLNISGDVIVDIRLLDYLISLLSTSTNYCFDGTLKNEDRLKEDLYSEGVFHPKMSIYCLYRPRLYHKHNFSGFEGRYYSLFESFMDDFSHAINLQILITAYAYKNILKGNITHSMISDEPHAESQRRVHFFHNQLECLVFLLDRISIMILYNRF